jgi:hypothetical protein
MTVPALLFGPEQLNQNLCLAASELIQWVAMCLQVD